MRNDRQAYLSIVAGKESKADKVKRIMAGNQSFAFRLAAVNAVDSNKGKVW